MSDVLCEQMGDETQVLKKTHRQMAANKQEAWQLPHFMNGENLKAFSSLC